MNILTVNLLFSTLVFWIAAKIYLLPRLHELKPQTVLLPILLLHSFRHLGLMFLAPGATYAGIPPQFAYPAAFGDLLAAILALVSIPLVAKNLRSGRISYASSTWWDRWICSQPLHWQPSMMHRHTWVQPTGSPRSGFLHYWSRITSRSLSVEVLDIENVS
jgi:hypothetical protein